MSEEVVTNTDTSGIQETIEKSGGDSPTSFDELEAVDAYKQRQEQLKSAPKEKEEPKAKPKAKAEKFDGLAEDAAKKAKDKTDLEADTQEEPEEDLPPARTFKLKNGKDEVELRSDTIIPVKVDGIERDMPFEEVVRRASGDVAVETRFNQLHQERQIFEEDKRVIDDFVKDVYESALDNPIQGLLKAVEKAGMDPIQYELNLMEEMAKRGEQWASMTDEQREAYVLRRENEKYKAQQEMQQQSMAQNQQVQQMETQVEQLKQQHGIEHQEFVEGYQELLVEWKQGNIPGEITPELVADYVLDQRKIGTATEILEGIDQNLGQDSSAIQQVVELMYRYPQLDSEDIKDLVKEHYKVKSPAKKASEKLRSGKPDLVEPGTKVNPDKDLTSWDQLESLYR